MGVYQYKDGKLNSIAGAENAAQVYYDNTGTSLSATNAQDAITELNTNLTSKQDKTDNTLSTTDKTVVGAINELNNDLTASDDLKFRFATDGEGNHGYLGADDSFIPFSYVKHLGHFTGNTSINVSSLGATSASQFLIVCDSSKSISGTGSAWYARDNVDLHYPHLSGTFSPASKTLNNGALSITAPRCSANSYNLIGDNPNYPRGSVSASGSIPYDVYFISNAQ